jgi:tetratricopeptide (TPR) repeat protein
MTPVSDIPAERIAAIRTVEELSSVLRHLRRREAWRRRGSVLTYRDIADRAGWSHGVVGAYFAGSSLPPSDRYGRLLGILGATPAELGGLVMARDRVDELRRAVTAGRRARNALPRAPAQLPLDVAAFTGRGPELAALDRLVPDQVDAGETAPRVALLSGTAGVGKTALAVHWAHRISGDFPHGQLYVDLRGYAPDDPVGPGDALGGFLRALGHTQQEIAHEVEQRAAQFRTELAGRRMLLILDNAATVEQVRPLLPGAGSSLVVVTSRNAMAGLVARNGAVRIDLGRLPPPDARCLLDRLIGADASADAASVRELAAQCAGLPLALRVVAELATGPATASLPALAKELADVRRRLDRLDASGDPRTAMRTVFSWSYRQLPAAAARLFRLAALHPGAEFDAYAAAALGGVSLHRVVDELDVLAREHLVERVGAGRYGMHDLIRAYAARLTAELDSEPDRVTARLRLRRFYLAVAAAAMDILHPAERHLRPPAPPAGAAVPAFGDPTAALSWLDAERANLVAATDGRGGGGSHDFVTRLAATLSRYLDNGGHHADAATVYRRALASARRVGDRAAEAQARDSLGVVYARWHRLGEALDHHNRALALARRLRDLAGEARVLSNLGTVYAMQNRMEEAVDHHQRARAVFRKLGDGTGQARALGNLGVVSRRQGRPVEAIVHQRQALALFRHLRERVGEAEMLNALGESLQAAGDFAEARTEHATALLVAMDIGNRNEQAAAHRGLAAAYRAAGDPHRARQHWRRAAEIYTELGLPEAAEIRDYLVDNAPSGEDVVPG